MNASGPNYQIAIRLPKDDVDWLDRIAESKSTNTLLGHASRADVVREILAWARSEGFFGPKSKGKARR